MYRRWKSSCAIFGSIAAPIIIGANLLLPSAVFSQPNSPVTILICHNIDPLTLTYTPVKVDLPLAPTPISEALGRHGIHPLDIVPTFQTSYMRKAFPGRNFYGEGLAIWQRGCQSATPTYAPPEPVPTPLQTEEAPFTPEQPFPVAIPLLAILIGAPILFVIQRFFRK